MLPVFRSNNKAEKIMLSFNHYIIKSYSNFDPMLALVFCQFLPIYSSPSCLVLFTDILLKTTMTSKCFFNYKINKV